MKAGMRFLCVLLAVSMICPAVLAEEEKDDAIHARSYILIEQETGEVLMEQNPDEPLPIASVTKVMTMLLGMEAIQSGKISMNDMVTCSEYAASMGGSQVYLEPGEQMSMTEIFKSIAVASGNDAAVALGEHIMGSETAFVEAMNERAKSLGMKNTQFKNCTGLDEEGHYSSARDVSIMSRELLKHKDILQFTTIWMDSVRNGEFGLANTNKLIRFYQGAIGLKTGSTSVAKYCLSAAAKRNDLTLIAVIIAAESTADRFEGAKKLLDYGFANYAVQSAMQKGEQAGTATVHKGKEPQVEVVAGSDFKKLMPKGDGNKIEKKLVLYENIRAPIAQNQKVGEATFSIDGKEVGKIDLVAKYKVDKITVGSVYADLLKNWSIGK